MTTHGDSAMKYKNYLITVLILFQSTVCGAVSNDSINSPFPAHAHNDYLHERPLFDAIENGFRSIEADVFSMGDSLYVAHDRKDIATGRTFRSLYLNPLRVYLSGEGGAIYDSAGPLILLVDIKDNGLSTYQLLDLILHDYQDMLCQVKSGGYKVGPVMVIISGNRPIGYMEGQRQRFAFVDGRIKDLEEDYHPKLMPLISDRWGKHFSWRGKGKMPCKERGQLRIYVQEAHKKGSLIRFWATPDIPGKERDVLWDELLEAGVDLINTDDLVGLRSYFSAGWD